MRTMQENRMNFNNYKANNRYRNNYSFDQGPNPFAMNLKQLTMENDNFRTALWTGCHLQLTLMCIPPNSEIGLEIHPELEQFLYIESGQGIVVMGRHKDFLNFKRQAFDNTAIIIPAGTWHNLINTGDCPIKLFSIYAPPQHPWGTIHRTKADSDAAETEH